MLEVYSERLEPNKIKENLITHGKNVEQLCELRLKQTATSNQQPEPWTMEEFDAAVKDLDNDKSRDALGHVNKLYKKGVAVAETCYTQTNEFNKRKTEIPRSSRTM